MLLVPVLSGFFMEHACKLCDRTFANGRALGGHMRSHMAVLPPCPAPTKKEDSSSSFSLSSSRDEQLEGEEDVEDDVEEGKGVVVCYGLRENPKRSRKMVDLEFSFAVDAGSVVQDRESEAESPPAALFKRRRGSAEPAEREELALSSVSDTTPEEDVALCLMMLSRDVWSSTSAAAAVAAGEDADEEEKEMDEEEEYKSASPPAAARGGRYKYQCGTCNKLFRSYQALGGHRASHKKNRACPVAGGVRGGCGVGGEAEEKIHQCPVCNRVFASGQALGGHKRSHLLSAASKQTSKVGDVLIDLNLPAPLEEDEASQVELSAVSDVEFADSDV